ncbi:rho GTPase-activating protein gacHH isoform X2 [Nematostella vectensis]|uniref:rho GTPase-activating protein gacHH isoform X2 n=1 Tax=Nematostella vectensis TaxID=45351 RepID=UPI0013900211|nr:rho GTPase-activating protein gacHH isoform X2 [Nematostella vectensis]
MGNEGSVPVSYGTRLLNDVKVEWKRSGKDCVYSPRDGHCAASVGSKLYVFGGVAWNVTIGEVSEMNEMLVYDLESQTWSKPVTRGDTPSSRSSATMCSVGNTLFMFGGLSRDSGWLNDLYAFNTDSMQWKAIEAKGTYPSPRDKLGSVAMGTKMLIFGGFGPKEDDEMAGPGEAEFTWFNDIFAFDTENLTWKKFMVTTVGSPTPRAAHCMCAVGFKVVIFGGKDSIARRHDTHILNTENMKWETVKTSGRQPSPRSFHSCAAVGNRMVVFGGRGLANQHFNDLHIFDVDKQEWLQPSVSGALPAPRGVHTMSALCGNLVVFGGSSEFDESTMQCQQYHNDTFLLSADKLLSGASLGPDPNDKPKEVVPMATPVNPEPAIDTIDENEEEWEDTEEDDSSGQEH